MPAEFIIDRLNPLRKRFGRNRGVEEPVGQVQWKLISWSMRENSKKDRGRTTGAIDGRGGRPALHHLQDDWRTLGSYTLGTQLAESHQVTNCDKAFEDSLRSELGRTE